MVLFLVLCILAFPAAVLGAPVPVGGEGGDAPSLAVALIKMLFALIMVLGLLLLGLHGVRKMKSLQEKAYGGDMVKVLTTKGLAPKKYVSVIEVGGEVMVLGLSETSVTLLGKMNKERLAQDIGRRIGSDGPEEKKRGFLSSLSHYSRGV